MSTGDLNGNLQRLLRELKTIKCPTDVDEVGLRLGDPVALLPLLNFTLLKFSRHVARFIVRNGFELAGKTDQRFVESCFKLFRDVLNVRTVLTPAQFFEQGYAERKVLLLCDVIAVSKKLHNEEVRQERLAALKATRQDQASSRLAAPRRGSPLVKVVRNDDIEIQQVLAPQHLPNASDGSQSVYKTKKVVTTARSPSPSPGVQPAAGKAAHRQQSSLDVPPTSSKGSGLELTFRPGAPATARHVAQRQAPGSSAAAPPPPIHTWFMNPAFAEGDEATLDLGLRPGATGRPDSSAWWRLAPSPPDRQAPSPWWHPGASQVAPADRFDVAGGGADSGMDSGRHLFFGRQPAAASTTAAAPQGSLRQAGLQPPPQQQPGRGDVRQAHLQAAAGAISKGGAAGGAVAVGSGTGAIHASPRGHALPSRDLDEWSFSKFFGPGKADPRRHVVDDDTDDSSQHAGDTDDGDATGAQRASGVAVEGNDLERDGPAPDQDHRFAGARPATSRPIAPRCGSPGATPPSPTRQQPRPGAAGASAAAGVPGPVGRGGMEFDWQAQLAKLERETQQQVQELKDKVKSAEQELEKTRFEARQSHEALQARVTVLEGRVRFLECELELCVKRAPGQSPPRAGSPGQAGERAASSPARSPHEAEPSLAWRSPGRAHSAGAAAQHHSRESPPRPAALSRAADTAAAAAVASRHDERHVHSAAAHPAPDAAGRGVGLRWGTQSAAQAPALLAAGGAAYPLYSSYAAVSGRTAQAGPSAPAQQPQQNNLSRPTDPAPAATQPFSLLGSGGPGHHALPSFSPMPPPTFSFEPSSLMQQVASAAAPPLPQQQQQSPAHQPGRPVAEAGRPTDFGGSHEPGSRRYGSSLDSAHASAGCDTAGAEAHQGGMYPDPGSARAGGVVDRSMDAGLRRQAFVSTADGAAAPRGDVGSAADASSAFYRGSESLTSRGGLPASILGRSAAAVGAWEGSADSATASRPSSGQQQRQHRQDGFLLAGADPTAAASSGQQQQRPISSPSAKYTAALPNAQALANPAPGMSSGTDGGARGPSRQSAPPSAGGLGPGIGNSMVSASPGAGAAGADGSRNAVDIINHLHLRYTEASDFMQALRNH